MSALYMHIPFCEKKCFYCSFVVSIAQEKRMDKYLDSLRVELMRHQLKSIETVYVGGGTPSMLTEENLRMLVEIIKNSGAGARGEWTIELNPESSSFEKIQVLKEGGFNRFSLGVQTFQDRYLKYLGRNHSSSSAHRAVDELHRAGIDNINVDLMFGYPGQTIKEVQSDLKDISSLGCQHISLYALTIEAPSRFHAQKVRLDDELQGQQYRMIVETLATAGFVQYEVSNFARPGKESAHNINYWTGGNYIGLGIGAHSHRDGARWWNIAHLSEYITRIHQGKCVVEGRENLSAMARLTEALIFGLRMNRGVDLEAIEQKYGCVLDKQRREVLEELVENRMLVKENSLFRSTMEGRLMLDEISARLV